MAYGTLTGVSIGNDGVVSASYSNGQTMAIYKIPVANFANADGLDAMTGAIYSATQSSGSATLHQSGTGGVGDIKGGELESSTTD